MRGKKKREGVSKAEALAVAARVDELVRIRLDGAQFWDVREYVREKEAEDGSPWKLVRGAKPLSDSQIRRYVQRADKTIQRSAREKRGAAIRRHIARRENLYAKAVNGGDVCTALAVLRDLAELRGLYPVKKTEVTFPQGLGATPEDVEAGRARVEEHRRRRLAGAPSTNGTDHTTNGGGR
jgi:hypothetical protein